MIGEVVSIASVAVPLMEKMVTYRKSWIKLKGNNKAVIRSLFLEVERNRAVLNALDVEHKDVKQMDLEPVQNLFSTIDTSVMETILFGIEDDKDKDIWEYLSKMKEIEYKEEEESKKTKKTLFGLMYFVVNRAQVLQSISKIDSSFTKNIRVKQRLGNIKEHLGVLEKALKQFPEIKEMLGS